MHLPSDLEDYSRSGSGEKSADPSVAVPIEGMSVWALDDDEETPPEADHVIPYSVRPEAMP
jgi:hypothetical protein